MKKHMGEIGLFTIAIIWGSGFIGTKLALDGGKDGLDFYRRIAKDGYKYLNRQGYLCMEIGYDQRIAVRKIIDNEKRYVETYSKKDLCQNDRIIVTRIG